METGSNGSVYTWVKVSLFCTGCDITVNISEEADQTTDHQLEYGHGGRWAHSYNRGHSLLYTIFQLRFWLVQLLQFQPMIGQQTMGECLTKNSNMPRLWIVVFQTQTMEFKII